MKKRLWLCAMALACPAWAGWVDVGQEGASAVLVDPASVQRQGDIAQAWALINHPAPRRLVEVSYQSQKKHLEFRCPSGDARVLATTLHGGAMGEGKVVYEDNGAKDWQPVEADSAMARLRDSACR